jgi:hypothetical protein
MMPLRLHRAALANPAVLLGPAGAHHQRRAGLATLAMP